MVGTDPLDKLINVISDFILFLKLSCTTFLGWLIMVLTSISTFLLATFGDKITLIHWVILAIFVDLFFGALSAYKRRVFKISSALVSTAIKLTIYTTIFFMPLILEKILSQQVTCSSIGTITITVLLCTAEYISTIAHMLVIRPNLWGLKVLKRALSGEMAKKLNMTPDEFEQYIKDNK